MYQLIKQTNTQATDGAQVAGGWMHNCASSAVSYTVKPYGQYFAAGLVTSSAPDTSGGIVGAPPTRIATASATTYASLSATSLTGGGVSGVFSAVFTTAGVLDTIKATTAGTGYLVDDKLRIAVPTNTVPEGTKVASLTVTTAVSGADGRDVELTITPTSSRATAVLPKVKVKVEAGGTITDDAAYALLADATGLTTGDTITFDADNNDEGNTYADGWTFTVTLADSDFSTEDVDFRLVKGTNDTTATILLPAGERTPYPVREYTVIGSTARIVAVYALNTYR
jgi:hypothetical protein